MQTEFSRHDIEIINRETVYQGFFKIEKLQLRFKLFQGGWSKIIDRELFVRNNAIAVLPYDSKRDEVVLIQQMRLGTIHDATQNPWIVELAAGIIEKDEQPIDVAYREMMEETGLQIIKLEPIYNFFVSPGGSTEKLFLFFGLVDSTKAGGIFGFDEAENIRVITIKSDEAFQMLQTGKINNAYTIIALQWLKINRDDLKKNIMKDN
jgi:ADP-ribose pyrophosphatase